MFVYVCECYIMVLKDMLTYAYMFNVYIYYDSGCLFSSLSHLSSHFRTPPFSLNVLRGEDAQEIKVMGEVNPTTPLRHHAKKGFLETSGREKKIKNPWPKSSYSGRNGKGWGWSVPFPGRARDMFVSIALRLPPLCQRICMHVLGSFSCAVILSPIILVQPCARKVPALPNPPGFAAPLGRSSYAPPGQPRPAGDHFFAAAPDPPQVWSVFPALMVRKECWHFPCFLLLSVCWMWKTRIPWAYYGHQNGCWWGYYVWPNLFFKNWLGGFQLKFRVLFAG